MCELYLIYYCRYLSFAIFIFALTWKVEEPSVYKIFLRCHSVLLLDWNIIYTIV